MPEFRQFPACYDPASVRAIVTPSAFARGKPLLLAGGRPHPACAEPRRHPAVEPGQLSDRAGRGRQRQSAVRRAAVCAAGRAVLLDRLPPPPRLPQRRRRPLGAALGALQRPQRAGFLPPLWREPVFTPADGAAVARRLDAVLACASRWDATAELEASAEIAALLAGILGGQVRVGAPRGESGQAARLEAVRAYLADHCAEPLTLDELAARFFISKYYLARSFKQRYGETILDCLHAARIDRAKQMLRYTDQTLAQIAAACGFREQAYFTRRFKSAEGQPPTAYRRAWRGRRSPEPKTVEIVGAGIARPYTQIVAPSSPPITALFHSSFAGARCICSSVTWSASLAELWISTSSTSSSGPSGVRPRVSASASKRGRNSSFWLFGPR